VLGWVQDRVHYHPCVSIVHLNHIRKKLEQEFCSHIDMRDYVGKSQAEIEAACLSRALAAFAVAEHAQVSPAEAAADVVDGFGDNGIDAIGVDRQNGVVVVVQSKWDQSGKGSPTLGDVEKFLRGFNDLLVPRFDRFNEKIKAKSAAITAALDNTAVRFELVLVHSGQQPLSSNAQSVIDDLLREINDVSEIVAFHYLGQAQIHAIVRQGVAGASPDLAVTLHDWGSTEDPYRAFYGQVDAADVAEWWADHRATLFDRNLRKFIHDSSVNAAITSTLINEPAKFWYFNNGITVLCNRVQKAPAGGSSRRSGKFVFEGATVVNGAQTVGSIGRAAELDPSKASDARVHIRFISLEHCPPDFATEVTRATNTQNRVERRDFVAIDPEQERLRTDLLLEQGKTYAIKTGEPDPARSQGCTVVEATVALACAHSSDLAVQAKREIGRLWEDVSKPPYKLLFNGNVTATRLWRAVEVLRAVDDTLRTEQDHLEGRDRSVAVHGNRLIANAVFGALPPKALDAGDATAVTASVPGLTRRALTEVQQIVERDYPSNVLAALFKNASRCRDVIDKLPDLTQPTG
jgi:hypothetical protein